MTVTLHEASHALELDRHYVIEIVEAGIVEPQPRNATPEDWVFDADMLNRMQRACRLYRDLELDWPATALVLDLLAEKEQLQRENQRLHRLLRRFIED
ncbi:MAG: chaperone modulator CbpM [Pseudomonadota bacterium]